MEKIKLVIWDLDETFWKGTLSEEGVEQIEENIALVKELTDRGIMNSIVSKNDYAQAKAKLEEWGIWDYFIFPAIDWAPKGELIKRVIENCQLRDVNVLFLDDNHSNLKEAVFYNPNLYTHFPDMIPQLLNHKALAGKDDKEHSRLEQYKVLETKHQAKESFSSNSEFLRSSNIQVEIIKDLKDYQERISEMIERTNQLNFTKIRSSEEEVKELLADKDFSSAAINVMDNFGDYGIVGFYSLHIPTNTLKHFVFSCRILNLGVAQYLYAKLGFPKVEVVPEVAEELDNSKPNWIKEVREGEVRKTEKPVSSKERLKIFFKGGCDLEQMLFYLKNNDFEIEAETNYVSKDNFSIHQEHTQILLDSLNLSEEDKSFIQSSDIIPFTDENFYRSKVFDFGYDCLVYSVLMDYTQELYLHKERQILLPSGGYYNHWTDTAAHENIIGSYAKRNIDLKKDNLLKFTEDFERLGQISPEKFIDNLKEIRKNVPVSIPIVFINGTEVEAKNSLERNAAERHKAMNAALDRFIEKSENTHLLDIRKIVTDAAQLTDNIRHYNREVYKDISAELLNILNRSLGKKYDLKIGFKERLRAASPAAFKLASKIKSVFK